ncbi:hypothetical protein RFI_21949 [Reticulomyxa filosa]|uniref:U1-type domain-containing protein n=1 Tax=Reticulomyxa filosa TaxID=46433 RepID=X6MQS1_RETFI|nr:hypothetical protein RFI_21949 [Reticulomyxa filosa]|eukprot:ETO15415.1 hypothetical protein RFI_21949 [Reticulomyxa filosa]
MSLNNKNLQLEERKTWDKDKYGRIAKQRAEEENKELLNLDLDTLEKNKHNQHKRVYLEILHDFCLYLSKLCILSTSNLAIPYKMNKKIKKGHRGAIIKRELLKPRNEHVDISAKIGERVVITKDSDLSEMGGWYCHDCKCQLKDSHTYFDHMNGKKHQRKLGMSMKVPNSTLHEVQVALEKHKRTFQEMQSTDAYSITEKLEKKQLHEQQKKKVQKQQQKDMTMLSNKLTNNKNANNNNDKQSTNEVEIEITEEEMDPEMAALGFDFQFGGSNKNK